jgi:hypothetical protein
MVFRDIGAIYPILDGRNIPRVLTADAAIHHDAVGVAVGNVAGLAVRDSGAPPLSPPASHVRFAGLLRERGAATRRPVGCAPGIVAARFALSFPEANPVLFEAAGAPLDALVFDAAPWDEAHGGLDQLARAHGLCLRAEEVARGQHALLRTVTRRPGAGQWLEARFLRTWVVPGTSSTYCLNGWLAFSLDGKLLHERGDRRPGEEVVGPLSWLVVEIDDGAQHRKAVRLRGSLIAEIFSERPGGDSNPKERSTNSDTY